MKKKTSPYEKELARLYAEEKKYLASRMNKKESALNNFLEEKVPPKLQETLDAAFAKAFGLVFEKGTGLIELSYNRQEKEKQFLIDEFTAQVRGDRRSLRRFAKKAGSSGGLNLALSGAAGIGLGVLGIGLPDIALFTGFMLKSIYEIALSYGFDYSSEEEKAFILRLIFTSLAYGEELRRLDADINRLIIYGSPSAQQDIEPLIERAASCLSGELLYMKFLQGVPFVGAVGGAYDAVYIRRITRYAELKYRRRFYEKMKQKLEKI